MEKIIVSAQNSGQRIDKFLMQEFFLDMGISRGEVIRNIKAGNVLVYPHTKINNKKNNNVENHRNIEDNFGVGVNQKSIKPSYILKEGDVVILKIETEKKGIKPNSKIDFEIIFENNDFIIINKPAGLQVHPVKSLRDHGASPDETLVNGLLYKFPEIKTVGDDPENRPGIVHRLDKDTSGIMIVAKNQKSYLDFKEKFKNREIQKTYWAIVYGKMKNKKGVIDSSLARSANYKKQVIASEKTKTKIRQAVTEYNVLKSNDEFSLVEVKPKTGRMHQIRVHLFSIEHPILGDSKYILKNIKLISNIKRHLLHAKMIEFSFSGNNFRFEANLPSDFKAIIDKLGVD